MSPLSDGVYSRNNFFEVNDNNTILNLDDSIETKDFQSMTTKNRLKTNVSGLDDAQFFTPQAKERINL